MQFSKEERLVQWLKIILFTTAGIWCFITTNKVVQILLDIKSSLLPVCML